MFLPLYLRCALLINSIAASQGVIVGVDGRCSQSRFEPFGVSTRINQYLTIFMVGCLTEVSRLTRAVGLL